MRGVTDFMYLVNKAHIFLLTRLMRGVTYCNTRNGLESRISTHTPHARRDGDTQLAAEYEGISTHTPHARRDLSGTEKQVKYAHFYSHASCEA